MVAAYASRGCHVVGVDLDEGRVAMVNAGTAPVFEPGLGELLADNRGRISATTSIDEAVRETDLTFIIVPTPSEPHGGFSLRHVLPACRAIGRALREKPAFHLVVLTATVMPGSTGGEVRACLEAESGKVAGGGFGLCYSPEFIALGSVIHDLLNPDFVLIGEVDRRSGDLLESVYRHVCTKQPAIARMNFVNAELTKLCLNTFVTTKITFANMVAGICERLEGADVDTVTSALGLDSRVGRKYLKGALGYGGPCFPRDNLALMALARSIGAGAGVAEATDRVNRSVADRVVAMVRERLPEGGSVGILGLAYKPDTDVVERSQAIDLVRALAAGGYRVAVHDPAAMANARAVLGEGVAFTQSAEECIAAADCVVLATPWKPYTAIAPAVLARSGRRRVLIDCWRAFDPTAFGAVVDYVALGIGAVPIASVHAR
jgi:UDPglucose 6-dehydrogenase